MRQLALDTSAAVPYLMRSHAAHDAVVTAVEGSEAALTAHSLAETYGVLTRLPGDARLAAADAVRLIDASFQTVLTPPTTVATTLHHLLASAGIAGGAAYDALVALTAAEAGATLATRDRRAAGTYDSLAIDRLLIT